MTDERDDRRVTGNVAAMILGEVKGINRKVDRLGENLAEHRAEFAEHEGRDEARHAAMIDRVARVEDREEITGQHNIVALEKERDRTARTLEEHRGKTVERIWQLALGILLAVLGAAGGYVAARK